MNAGEATSSEEICKWCSTQLLWYTTSTDSYIECFIFLLGLLIPR